MTPEMVVQLIRQTLMTTFWLAAPLLAIGFIAGLIISLFQAVTSINEQTLSFVPKALCVLGVLLLLLPWLIRQLVGFTASIIEKIPQMSL